MLPQLAGGRLFIIDGGLETTLIFHLGLELAEANRRAVALIERLRASAPDVPAVLNGVVGPRGDGYVVGEAMTAEEAEAYHGEQIGTFAGTASAASGPTPRA